VGERKKKNSQGYLAPAGIRGKIKHPVFCLKKYFSGGNCCMSPTVSKGTRCYTLEKKKEILAPLRHVLT